MKNPHNYHIDFIKIKWSPDQDNSLNYETLEPHPTLNRCYRLKACSRFYANNFKLYKALDGSITIETSLPYLKYGHNYVEMDLRSADTLIQELEQVLGINLEQSQVLQFEYGYYASVSDSNRFIKSIRSLSGYDLNLNKPGIKMFGSRDMQFKIYDAVRNAKKKKTYTRGGYPSEGLIKFEIKVTDVTKHLKNKMTLQDLINPDNEKGLKDALHSLTDQLVFCGGDTHLTFRSYSIDELLYACVIKSQAHADFNFEQYVMDLIKQSHLSHSQKSKRRRAFTELKGRMNVSNNHLQS